MAGQREILAERIAGEAIIGQDAAQVWMSGKHNAVKVEGFALIPVCAWPDVRYGFQHREVVFLGKDAHPQARVMRHRQEVIDQRKTLALTGSIAISRIIDTAQVDHLLETRRIAQA